MYDTFNNWNNNDGTAADNDGWTLLHYAAKKGHFKICKLIIENVDDKNPADNDG